MINYTTTMMHSEQASSMQKHRIQALLVVDNDGVMVGALNFQDLLSAGIV